MTDTKQTLTLECCCQDKRQFHIHTEIDSGAGGHLVSQVVKCPFCERSCKIEIEAGLAPVERVMRSRVKQPDNVPDSAPDDAKRLRRMLRDRVFSTELADRSE
uniref:Uncharacterized protein n=1 Tax=Candidatus Kentrum sp. MB TaxID=2138164 RepID=A0A450XUQ9_9GAMM|nr:MAG: hypothetical protein BECKMB1821G_GA0114241_11347 [Candidatus Kentron sp. MB]